jgi:chorismate synthase
MIRFSTAGESHGEALIALVSGLPAGVPVDLELREPRVVAPAAGLSVAAVA